MSKIVAYLLFPGSCRAAMTFYQQCLGGELNLMPFAEAPDAGQLPDDARDGVMHANLVRGPLMLMASDDLRSPVVTGNSVSLSLDCATVAEAEAQFAALSQGGTVTLPLADQFWGARFGMLTDQFGIHWMVNHDYRQGEPAAIGTAAATA